MSCPKNNQKYLLQKVLDIEEYSVITQAHPTLIQLDMVNRLGGNARLASAGSIDVMYHTRLLQKEKHIQHRSKGLACLFQQFTKARLCFPPYTVTIFLLHLGQ